MLIGIPFLSGVVKASSEWEYNKRDNYIYSIYKSVDDQKWSVFVVPKLTKKGMVIEALIPLSEYKKYFTFDLEPCLLYNGKRLVKHDIFFWGKKNQ